MKFAYLIMGGFDDEIDKAEIHGGVAQIVGVSSLEAAAKAARRLQEQGIDCIELCGAFGPDGARVIVQATGNKIPVGYITHLEEQNDIYKKFFPND